MITLKSFPSLTILAFPVFNQSHRDELKFVGVSYEVFRCQTKSSFSSASLFLLKNHLN